jgi:hypothetical protein
MSQFTIPASPNDPNPRRRFSETVDVILGGGLENNHKAAGKNFPDGLPSDWTDPVSKQSKKIKWISNFGLTDMNGDFVYSMPAGSSYTVRMPKLNKSFVWYDGKNVQPLTVQDVPGEPGKVEATITQADPPVGMVS